jgi:hypothetical protein
LSGHLQLAIWCEVPHCVEDRNVTSRCIVLDRLVMEMGCCLLDIYSYPFFFILKHRYLWAGPYVAPFSFFSFFFLTSTFFHINNILQLSMYHCMTYIQYIQSNSSFYPFRVSDMIYRHGMCFRASSVFVLSILFCFPQRTHYF